MLTWRKRDPGVANGKGLGRRFRLALCRQGNAFAQGPAGRDGPLFGIKSTLTEHARRSAMFVLGPKHVDLTLLLARPHDAPKVSLASKHDAGSQRGLDENRVAFDPVMSPLPSSIPFFVPGYLYRSDEIASLDAVAAAVGLHRLVKRGSLYVVHATNTVGACCHNDAAPFRRQHEIAFRRCAEHVVGRAVLANDLPAH